MDVKRCCVITRQILDRSLLFRVVKDHKGIISIDLSYNTKGRGAYILKDVSIIETAKKKDALSRALRHKVDVSVYEELIKLAKGE